MQQRTVRLSDGKLPGIRINNQEIRENKCMNLTAA